MCAQGFPAKRMHLCAHFRQVKTAFALNIISTGKWYVCAYKTLYTRQALISISVHIQCTFQVKAIMHLYAFKNTGTLMFVFFNVFLMFFFFFLNMVHFNLLVIRNLEIVYEGFILRKDRT